MAIPIQITYRKLERTEAIDAYVRKRAQKLIESGHPVLSCRIAVETPHGHKLHGRHYRVRIDFTVPGAELVVDRSPDVGGVEDLYAAIDEAFDHAVRRLHAHANRSRSGIHAQRVRDPQG
jgi:ribosome-associated translation inhibitor RaiA